MQMSVRRVSASPLRSFLHTESASARLLVAAVALTLFFLVAGLEARRESDLGDLPDHCRLILPVLAGLTGMAFRC